MSEKGCHLRCHCDGSVRIEKQRSGTPCEYVLNLARHLFSGCPDDLGGDIGQIRMKLFCQLIRLTGDSPDLFCVRPIDGKSSETFCIFYVAMDVQALGDALAVRQFAKR